MRWLCLVMLVAGCQRAPTVEPADRSTLDSSVIRRWPYRQGDRRRIRVGDEWLGIQFASSSTRRVLDDFLALKDDVVTECARPGGDCPGDCLVLVGRFEPTLRFSERTRTDDVDERWASAEAFVEFELVGFEVLTPFRDHLWTGNELEARWAHGESTTLEARHFEGRVVNPAFYRRARPKAGF
jgi:hypothetical protein